MIASTVSRISYAGTGSTGPFGFGFKVFDPAHLLVTKRSALGTETTLVYLIDYTVVGIKSGVDNFGAGGTVTLTLPLAVGETLVIRRSPPDIQGLSVQNAGPFFPKGYEDQLDYITMLVQSAVDLVTRSVKLGETQDPAAVNTALPTPAADNVLGWSSDGKSLVNKTTVPGQQINTAIDPQDLKSKFAVPGLDLLVSVLSKRGVQHYNDSGVLEALADEPTSHVTCYGRRHKAWGSTFGDGTIRVLTAGEITAHPEWIGKYIAGVHGRDDVLWCEAFYTTLASQGVKARGFVASVTKVSAGVYTVGLTLDSGATIDTSVGLVSALPLTGAGGLYNQGMVGAMFMTVDGQYPFLPHMVDSNTANSINLAEATPPNWQNGANYAEGNTVTFTDTNSYECVAKHTSSTGVNDPGHAAFWRLLTNNALRLPGVGDHFELIQFNGSGNKTVTRRIEIGNLNLRLTRAVGLKFCNPQVHGFGQLASTVSQSTNDVPIIAASDTAYFRFDGFCVQQLGLYSTRPVIDIDGTGFQTQAGNANGLAAFSSQQGKFVDMFIGGNFSGTYQSLLGTFGAPVAIIGPSPQSDGTLRQATSVQFTVPNGVTIKKNQFRGGWVVIAAAADARNIGKRYLIAAHEAANATDKLSLGLWFTMPGFAPSVGDTFFIESGCAIGVEFGAGNVLVQGSTGPQGSENMFIGCFISGFSAYGLGSITANALQQTVLGGNMASNPNWSIFAYWGNWQVTGCGFQSGTDPRYNQLNHARTDPSKYGFDGITINANIEATVLEGCRSESFRFWCNAGNPTGQFVHIRGCAIEGQYNVGPFKSNFGFWNTNLAVTAPGGAGLDLPTITKPNAPQHDDGRAWVVQQINGGAKNSTQTGSGTGEEPQWDQVTTGTVNEAVAGGPNNGDTITWYELNFYMLWLQNFLTNGNYNVIEGVNISIDEFGWRYAKLCPTGKRIGHIYCTRRDWASNSSPDWANTGNQGAVYTWEIKGPVDCAPPNAGFLTFAGWQLPAHAGGAPFDAFPFARRMGGVHPILWDFGDDGQAVRWEGGWGPGARTVPVLSPLGRRSTDPHFDYGHAVIAAQAPVCLAPVLNFADGNPDANNVGSTGITDKNGQDTLHGGGLPTGVGIPGSWRVKYNTMALAVSGANEPPTPYDADSIVVDSVGRFNTKVGVSKSAVAGVISISAAGNATPNPTTVEVSRYQINGAATFNNPIGTPIEGQAWTIEIFNNTAGALTPTFGTAYMGTAPSIGAGKWQTRRFVYDATLAKWKPTGAWSGDL